jgi:hypothetical protein
MVEAVRIPKTSFYFYETTLCYIPEGFHLHTRRLESLKSRFGLYAVEYQISPATRHFGAWGTGGIAPTHS